MSTLADIRKKMPRQGEASMPSQLIEHTPFWKIFVKDRHCAEMPVEWQHELNNYLLHGFEPGSFHMAVFSNNLFSATSLSHSSNQWIWIQAFMYFLYHYAPPQSWGSREVVCKWIQLTPAKRFEICHNHGLTMTDEEVSWHVLQTSA